MQENINFLYVWITSDEFELKNSVRVLRKNYPNASVCLVGDKPKTVDVDFYIPHKQKGTVRASRVTSSILHACQYLEQFVLMYDDLFLNKGINFNMYPFRGELTIKNDGGGYNKCLANTRTLLSYFKLPTKNYECHNPFLIDAKKAVDLFDKVNWQNEYHTFKSIYANYYKLTSELRSNAKTKDAKYFMKLYDVIGYCTLNSDVTPEMRATILKL
jgi:hypothetical protein